MTDTLRNEIRQIVKDLANGMDNMTFSEISNQAEELLDRALLAEFLAYRASRKTEIQQRLQQAIAATDQQETEPEKQPEPAKKEPEAEADENPFPFNPEIKVVPHPNGPPMPKQEHSSPTEKIEVQAQQSQSKMPLEETPAPASTKPASIAEKAQQGQKQKSLHDRLAAKNLSFGLNDRLAYVKHLFDGSTEDFNRVVSQLNTFSDWEEADEFIEQMVKPDYNWDAKPEYADRFLEQIKVRFE